MKLLVAINPSTPPNPIIPSPPPKPRQLLLSSDYLTNQIQILGPKMVYEAQFSTLDVPEIGLGRSMRGAESIKLAYVMM